MSQDQRSVDYLRHRADFQAQLWCPPYLYLEIQRCQGFSTSGHNYTPCRTRQNSIWKPNVTKTFTQSILNPTYGWSEFRKISSHLIYIWTFCLASRSKQRVLLFMVYLHTREVASRGEEWNFWSSPETRQELVLRQCWSLSGLWGGKNIYYLSAATLGLKFGNDPMSLPCKVDSKGKHSNRLNHAPSRDHKLISKEVTTTTTTTIISNRFNVTWKDRCRGCQPAFWHDQTCQPSLQPFKGWKKVSMKTTLIIIITFYTLAEKMGSLGSLNIISENTTGA